MKNELIIVCNLEAQELELRIARGTFQLDPSALTEILESKCRLQAIAALMTMAKHQSFSDKPSGDQATIACALKNRIAFSVGRIQAYFFSDFTSKSKVLITHDGMVSDHNEQHSFEEWTQPGSRLDQSQACRCTLPHMDRAPSTIVQEVVVSIAPESFKLVTATEAKI